MIRAVPAGRRGTCSWARRTEPGLKLRRAGQPGLPRLAGRTATLVLLLFRLGVGQAAGAEQRPETCDPGRYAPERGRMVAEQIRGRGVSSPAVLTAMERVGRHCFVPLIVIDQAYEDHPLPIGLGQTISQPYIVGLMTELLELKPTDRVLEIGTGSGYQAAILAEIVREVYSVEILEPLARAAGERLASLGYRKVKIKCGDGYQGWEEYAPFDAIMVTAGAAEIPSPLVRQLKAGGRICIPLGEAYQVEQLTVVRKDARGSVTTRAVLPVRFVPLVRGP